MKKRIGRIGLALAIVGVVFAGAIWVLIANLGVHENLYQGKPVSAWAAQLNGQDSGSSNAAFAVLNQEIIPQLSATLLQDTNDSAFKLALVGRLNDIPGVSIRFMPAQGRRRNAANSLGTFGPAAQAAVPALIQALGGADTMVRGNAAAALGKIHGRPEVIVPLLVKLLDDGDLNEDSAKALGDFGPLAKTAVPKLQQLSGRTDGDPGVRTLATRALRTN